MRKEIIEILEKYSVKFSKKSNTKALASKLKNSNKVDWGWISQKQNLSEEFIKEFQDLVNWYWISAYQKLSEEFIREFQNKVYWCDISHAQKLSEDFIKEFKNSVSWYFISKFQKLSEDFIKEFKNKVCWDNISRSQKLSEDFIKEFQDKVDWIYISAFQKLSEDFIKKIQYLVSWYNISKYQKLSKDFIKEFDLEIPEDNWLYTTTQEKLNYIKNNTNYQISEDNKFITAYKSVRRDYYSVFNFQYKYEIGKTYTAHCNFNLDNENSFGLSAWTKEGALDYHDTGKLLKVKIPIESIGAIVHKNNKIRTEKLTIIEEIKE